MKYRPEALRKIRKEHNMTQQQLANVLEISVNTLASYESGATEPDGEMLIKMAQVFNTTVQNLLHLFWGKEPVKQAALAVSGMNTCEHMS